MKVGFMFSQTDQSSAADHPNYYYTTFGVFFFSFYPISEKDRGDDDTNTFGQQLDLEKPELKNIFRKSEITFIL